MPETYPVINEHYYAERTVLQYAISTAIFCGSVGGSTAYRRIIVETLLPIQGLSPESGRLWPLATINWSALGSVSQEEAAKFTEALAWAVTEARRIDQLTEALAPTPE